MSVTEEEDAWLWIQIKAEAKRDVEAEPALTSYLYSTILSHLSLDRSLSFHLYSSTLLSTLLYDLFLNAFSSDSDLRSTVITNLCGVAAMGFFFFWSKSYEF
ncbi:hypothetical protein SO802_033803 [Lithocarpus litseifolius]|uniref:Serine acetyltransferase N-terminal domain-containing protein n=1 Tax=Lithocarpus litseifolius TaxID=425828 RepID=A0AAW2BFE3_9ROSI